MPTISEFYGIKVYLYRDHLPPHIHVRYKNVYYTFYLDKGEFKGNPPKTLRKLITLWYNENKKELMRAWELMQKEGKVLHVKPLE